MNIKANLKNPLYIFIIEVFTDNFKILGNILDKN